MQSHLERDKNNFKHAVFSNLGSLLTKVQSICLPMTALSLFAVTFMPWSAVLERRERCYSKNKRPSACSVSEYFYTDINLVQITAGDHNTRKYLLCKAEVKAAHRYGQFWHPNL